MLVDGKAIKWAWKDFSPWEMRADRNDATPDNYEVWLDRQFMDRLQTLRSRLGFPFVVTSYYRSPDYNLKHAKSGRHGPHTSGCAVDIQIYGKRAFMLINAAMNSGFTGIGDRQHGPHRKRYVHLDDLPDAPGRPRPYKWSYS